MSEWVVLSVLKFVFSKDFLGAINKLAKNLAKAPAWRSDINTFKAKIKQSDRELASAFREKILTAMKGNGFPETALLAFQNIFDELTINGFSYGCPKSLSENIRRDYKVFGA
jgi:hypothetical protein